MTAVTIFAAGIIKKTDVFGEFVKGAREGLRTSAEVIPPLIILMTATGMLRASGAFEMLTGLLAPVLARIGFPAECFPLALIRPVSGSGAAAVYESILRDNHPDSFVGRVASVMLGSTETTFYTLALYYGSAGIKNGRHTLAAAAAGDITGFVFSALTVRMFFR